MHNIPFQTELRPQFPNVYGSCDAVEFRERLVKIDEILTKSHVEHDIVTQALNQHVQDYQIEPTPFYQSNAATYHYKLYRHALRCNIARHLTGDSYRLFSIRLADSILFQWFTGISGLSSCKAISKSSLDRFEKQFSQAFIAEKISDCMASFSNKDNAQSIGLDNPIDYSDVWIDSTCLKAHIHFPVDWVLLRDAARSLLLAITTIRAQGLKHRMVAPMQLLKKMNKLCIAMTHTRRKKDSKKQRKKILRSMKALSHCIARHAQRYRELLLNQWQATDWSEAQMQQVIRRMDLILEQLPAAIKQAHERIISEKIIASSDKLLSLYDNDAHVIVRGKSGHDVEFGQGLLISEQRDGLIIDCSLLAEQPPSDNQLLIPTLTRIEKHYGTVSSVITDRAFCSAANDRYLNEKNIRNAICPKSPTSLQKQLTDPLFVALQTRRSQTEGRIGIFKNVFLGTPLRSRITANKRHAINWCVLSHNLWVLSRMALADEQARLKQAA